VKIVSVELLLGRVGGEEVTLDFADVALGTWQLVGEPDRGAVVAASGALAGTMFTAGRFVGLASWALQHAAAAQAAGGFENSDVRQLLAEANADLEATDLLARECAARAAAGGEHQRLQTAVRVTAPEMCGRVYERAMTVEGSEALTNRARLFDGWHQSRIVQVAQSGLRRTWHDATARDLTESTPEK
jgi:alkylation response protein AidB-like acyl-CoA dehydrogenase